MSKKEKNINKEFRLSSWAINNKTTIYVMMFIILFSGISAYFSMPRENFPEIKETKIYINSIYPGNTAEDVEKLITTPLEDVLKTVSNVVEITSTSQEDVSMIIVEFDEDIEVELAKQKVKDEIETEISGEDWPTFNGAKVDPNVFDLSMSEEMPILNINISVSISSFTFCFANSTSMSSSNSTIIIETSSCDVEVISTTLLTVFKTSSNGVVISFSTSSAVFPG